MKIGIKLFQILFFIFCCFVFNSTNIVEAGLTPGDGNPECNNASDCAAKYGQGEWLCKSRICSMKSVWFNKDNADFEESLVENPYDPNLEQTTAAIVSNNLAAWKVQAVGYNPEAAAKLRQAGISVPNGAVQTLASGITYMIANPPANTVSYFADVANEAGFIKQAYAQQRGFGWDTLAPTLPLWKVFRNIAYLAFVIIFIVLGFMIMFRSKIGGQAVVTVQAALPSIIITLLLITFSYAIASFMMDLIWLLIYLVAGLFENAGVFGDNSSSQAVVDFIVNKTPIGLVFDLFKGKDDIAANAGKAIGDIVDSVFEKNFLKGLSGVAGGLATFIFSIAMLIAAFKLFFQLLMAYISIILQVSFGPILLIPNAIPGNKAFLNWIKSIFANVVVFPAVVIMFLMAGILTGSEGMGIETDSFSQNLVNTNVSQIPLLGGGVGAGAFHALIGLGMIMIMPKILELIQKALKVESAMGGMGAAAMEPIQGAWGKVNAPLNMAKSFGGTVVGGIGSAAGNRIWGKMTKDPGIPIETEKQKRDKAAAAAAAGYTPAIVGKTATPPGGYKEPASDQ